MGLALESVFDGSLGLGRTTCSEWHKGYGCWWVQIQQRKLAEARGELEETKAALQASEASRLAAEAKVAELQQELENNAGAVSALLYIRNLPSLSPSSAPPGPSHL